MGTTDLQRKNPSMSMDCPLGSQGQLFPGYLFGSRNPSLFLCSSHFLSRPQATSDSFYLDCKEPSAHRYLREGGRPHSFREAWEEKTSLPVASQKQKKILFCRLQVISVRSLWSHWCRLEYLLNFHGIILSFTNRLS